MKNYIIGCITIASSLILSGCGSTDNNGEPTATSPSGFLKTANTFTSNDSNLTWQDNADVYMEGANSNTEAIQICSNRTIDGYSDWRLPTTEEINTLYAKNLNNLSYTYTDYQSEDYYDNLKLRNLSWTTYYSGGHFGVINEFLSASSFPNLAIFFPSEEHQSGMTYSIRCVRDNQI